MGNLISSLIDLIRVGKQFSGQPYVSYIPERLDQLQHIANMTLALRHDVNHGMTNFRVVVQPVVSAQMVLL